MWEQAIFDAVFNLVGAVRAEPTTIQDVANYYEAEVSDMLQKTGVNMLIFEILKIQAAILETDFQTVRCFSEKASYQGMQGVKQNVMHYLRNDAFS